MQTICRGVKYRQIQWWTPLIWQHKTYKMCFDIYLKRKAHFSFWKKSIIITISKLFYMRFKWDLEYHVFLMFDLLKRLIYQNDPLGVLYLHFIPYMLSILQFIRDKLKNIKSKGYNKIHFMYIFSYKFRSFHFVKSSFIVNSYILIWPLFPVWYKGRRVNK